MGQAESELSAADAGLLRLSFDVAQRAVAKGNHPFGAVLADSRGQVVLEAENTVVTEGDLTGHAETNLVRLVRQDAINASLADCTMYASTEPCPMCSGAIHWGNIGRVVYGLGQARFYSMVGGERARDALALGCREVLSHAGRPVQVVGPVLEDEAAQVHEGFWAPT